MPRLLIEVKKEQRARVWKPELTAAMAEAGL
jgi:hypothetical protein